MNDLKDNVNIRRESTQQRKLLSWRTVEEVVRATADVYDIPTAELLRKGNRGCEARQVLLYLAAVQCRGRYSLSTIAEKLGPITISGLDSARSKMSAKLKTNKQLRKRVGQVEKVLKEKHAKSKSVADPLLGGTKIGVENVILTDWQL